MFRIICIFLIVILVVAISLPVPAKAKGWIEQCMDQARLDPKGAFICFTKVIGVAYAHRGYIYERKGQYRRCVQEFDKAIRVDPTTPVLREHRARCLRKMRR